MHTAIAYLPGDGVGAEVMAAAREVMEAVARLHGLGLTWHEGPIGRSALPMGRGELPPETVRKCLAADAVLLGPLERGPRGTPRDHLAFRRTQEDLFSWLGVYASLRPIRVYPALLDAAPLEAERLLGTDLVVVSDVAAGIYHGRPRGLDCATGRCVATNTLAYSEHEVDRVARIAFQAAAGRRRSLVLASWEKVLETGVLWANRTREVAASFPEVRFEGVDFDTCVLDLILQPSRFDVLLGDASTGDLLAVEAAALTGTFAMHPAAFLGDKTGGVFGPGHGSAPNLAGRGIANPSAAILSGALLLEHALERREAAMAVRNALEQAIASGARTFDLTDDGSKALSTRGFTQTVIARLAS